MSSRLRPENGPAEGPETGLGASAGTGPVTRPLRALMALGLAGALAVTGTLPAAGAPGRPGAGPAAGAGSGAAEPTVSADGTGRYLLTVAPGSRSAVRGVLARAGVTPRHEFSRVVDGFAVDLRPEQAQALAGVAGISAIQPDTPVWVTGTQGSPPWGLDRTDGTADGQYRYPTSAGAGVRVYVVDTGTQTDRPQFEGRHAPGFSALAGEAPDQDCHGHGTHVAGTVASRDYGVAKSATVVPVKVLSCTGSGWSTDIIAGMDWVATNHPVGTPGVVNLSLGGGLSSSTNKAVDRLVAAGLFVVAAAGNKALNACDFSPASAPAAYTVGSVGTGTAVSTFSNTGPCVDGFAPGEGIVSVSPTGDTSRSSSGTSMAAPHVAGVAALHLGLSPTLTPAQLTAAVHAGTVPAVVGAPTGTTTALVTSRSVPGPGVPRNPRVAGLTPGSLTVAWDAPAPLVPRPVTAYVVDHRRSGDSAWLSTPVAAGTTSTTLTGLAAGTTYALRVRALSADEPVGHHAGAVSATTPASSAPGTPRGLTPSAPTTTSVTLTWAAPTDGSAHSYRVQHRTAATELWATSEATTTTATLKGLPSGTEILARVAAVSDGQQGPFTDAVAVRTIAPPGIPGTPASTGRTGTTLALTWTAASAGDAAVTDYEVDIALAGTTAWRTVADGVRSTVGASISGLTPGTAYVVRVRAVAGQVRGASTVPVTVRTAAPPTAPGAPALTSRTGTSLALTWTAPTVDPAAPVTDYSIQLRPAGTTTWVTFADGVRSSVGATVTGLQVGTGYDVRVRARTADTTGPFSATARLGTAVPPDAPQSVRRTSRTGTSLTLAWDAPASSGGSALTDYVIQYRPAGATTWTTVADGVRTTRSATVTGLRVGTGYDVRVAAVGTATGTGAYGSPVRLSTVALPGVPQSLRVSGRGATSLSFAWSAPASNGGAAITDYRVQISRDGRTWTTVADGVRATTGVTISGLSRRTGYSVRVAAINVAGRGAYTAAVRTSTT